MFSHFQIQTRNKYINLTEHLITTNITNNQSFNTKNVNKMSFTSRY